MFSGGNRKLHLTPSGKWFVGLTIILGVATVMAENNVFYLLESFLLGAMILSGVLSEITIATARVKWRRRPTIAGEKSRDILEIENRSRIPHFCLEIGEWKEGKFYSRAFIPHVPAFGKIKIEADTCYPERGNYKWDGIGFATRFPFGFAQKLRWDKQKGKRLVWPSRSQLIKKRKTANRDASKPRELYSPNKGLPIGRRGSGSYTEGEIREFSAGDDYRDVVWALSLKRRDPLVRVRRQTGEQKEAILDLRQDPGKKFEQEVRLAAKKFYSDIHSLQEIHAKDSAKLTIVTWQAQQIYHGSLNCLDALAEVVPQGSRKPREEAA